MYRSGSWPDGSHTTCSSQTFSNKVRLALIGNQIPAWPVSASARCSPAPALREGLILLFPLRGLSCGVLIVYQSACADKHGRCRLQSVRRSFDSTAHLRGYRLRDRPETKAWLLLIALAMAAIVVHGYHSAVEDAEIYLPAIKKALHPSLYPHNDIFFMSHARMTMFPKLIAASVRFSHLPLDWVLLLWQWFSIFLLLLACWHLGRLAFRTPASRWGGVALVASLLTLPVAGTALYVMDEYINPRSLSTPAVLFIIINVAERRYVRALFWMLFTAAIHPLMVVFGAAYAAIYLGVAWMNTRAARSEQRAVAMAALIPFGLFPPATDAYREALNSRPYFFLLRWHWYEWLGIFGPIALFAWWRWIARRIKEPTLQYFCVHQ